MANTLRAQSRKTALWNNRPVVVLLEDDCGETYYHGVMIGPAGMTIAQALKKLDAALIKAVGKSGWNYDHVFDEMKSSGFEEILAAEWWEHRA